MHFKLENHKMSYFSPSFDKHIQIRQASISIILFLIPKEEMNNI